MEQTAFGASEFADNPEPRCPCLLLLDTSGSMDGRAIDELNNGLILFKHELCADDTADAHEEVLGGPIVDRHDHDAAEHAPPERDNPFRTVF